jgi:zinc protease
MKQIITAFLFLSTFSFAQKEGKNNHLHDPMNVQVYVLKNGLTVMLSENHNTPQVFGVVAVKAGGKNDPKDATGMAHYLEHMLFKGTKTLGTWNYAEEEKHLKEIEKLYEELGKATDAKVRTEIQAKINAAAVKAGEFAIPNEMDRMLSEIGSTKVNAFTTEDFTAYFNEFPSNKLEQWLQIYDHRFENPVFRLFQSELETVYEEKNRSMDSPFSAVLDEFNKNFWKNHPYGQQPIIGFTEHLKNPSLEKMYEYFNTYYVANNMVLALSGDFDTKETMKLIEKYFGDWRKGTVPVFPEYKEAEFNGKESVTIKATPVKAAIRGYRTPKNGDKDQIPIQLVNYLLTNNEASGYLDNLSSEGKVTFTGLIPLEYNDYSASVLFVVPKIVGQSFEQAEKLIDEQVDIIRKGEFSNQLFEGAKISIQKNFEKQLENNEERALLMISAYTSNMTWKDYLSNYARVNQISKDEIVAVANKYYGPNHFTLYSKMGTPKKDKLSKPGFEPVIPTDGKTSEFYNEWKKTPSSSLSYTPINFKKDAIKTSIAKHVDFTSVNNPFNQVFNIQIQWGMGTLHDPFLKYLPSYLNKVGTESMSAKAFRQELFSLGASIEFIAKDNEFVLAIDGIDTNLDATLALVSRFLQGVKVDESISKIISNEVKSDRKLSYKDLNFMLNALKEYALYGSDSKFLNELTSKEIAEIKTEKFIQSFENVRKYGMNIHYSGSLNHQRVSASLEKMLQLKDHENPAMKDVNRPMKGFEENKVYFLNDKKAVQSQVLFVIDGGIFTPAEIAKANAFNLYFGADMSSLVFQEIREFRSLAYSTYASYTLAQNKEANNTFVAYVGCQGDKTEEAVSVMHDLIFNMPQKRDRAEAIQMALISEAISGKPGFRKLAETIENWNKLGFTSDPTNDFISYYNTMDFDDIIRFQETYLKGKNAQLLIVGNSKKFSIKNLEKYGKIQQVKVDQLVKQ